MPLDPFESRLQAAWDPSEWSQRTVVAAVSGGADSVALLRGLAAVRQAGRGELVVAHFNHRLRGAESDADEAFVRRLAEALRLRCEFGRAETLAPAEEDARRLRYAFLQQTAERLAARYLVTAHTAEDQAETILQRIVRGTGLGGLAGMRRARPLGPNVALLRPLLQVRRAELRDYLTRLAQPFREDGSNADLRYQRNRVRHELLPLIEQNYNPAATAALVRLGELANEAQAAIAAQADALRMAAVHCTPDVVRFDLHKLRGVAPFLLREVLIAVWRGQGWPEQAMGFREWSELAELLGSGDGPPSAAKMFPGAVRAVRTGEELVLARHAVG
ncbi:MAG TPA: tRNA lysidine(34) synthetase TilS [Pirellulales bacterium]|nr:tRNA lysidine(34) synthetase TilS [Pirellulales bacterium]